MRILMLGWEFPPFISGGLGTACYGLTRALNAMGTEILFVLPKAVPTDYSGHVKLLSPGMPAAPGMPGLPGSGFGAAGSVDFTLSEFDHVRFRTVPSAITNPYNTPHPNVTRIGRTERATAVTESRRGHAPGVESS